MQTADPQLTGGSGLGACRGGAQTSLSRRVHQDVRTTWKVLPRAMLKHFPGEDWGHRRGAVDAGGGGREREAGRARGHVCTAPGLGRRAGLLRGERRRRCPWAALAPLPLGLVRAAPCSPWPGGCLKQQLPLWAPVSRWTRPASLLKLASEDQLHPVVMSPD